MGQMSDASVDWVVYFREASGLLTPIAVFDTHEEAKDIMRDVEEPSLFCFPVMNEVCK